MRFKCSCGQVITVPDDAAGRRGLCPGCRRVLTVPKPEDISRPVEPDVAVPPPAEAGPPSAAVSAVGGVCTICQTTIASGEAAMLCPECRLPYHSDCWEENGGCATYGCPAAPRTVKPAEPRADDVARRGWGDTKKCPYCGEIIRAAALKCKFCNEVFASADPLTAADLTRQRMEKQTRGVEHTKAVIYFVASLLACGAPATAVIGGIWIFRDRPKFRAMDATDKVMIGCGFGISCLVSAIMILGILAAVAGA